VGSALDVAAAELRDHRRLARRQAAILRLSGEIAAAHDEATICQNVVRGLHDDNLGYELVTVLMADGTTGDRVLRAGVGLPNATEAWCGAAGFADDVSLLAIER